MASTDIPAVSTWFQGGFHRFLRPYLKRQFHAIAVQHESRGQAIQIDSDQPLIVYANHPGWWDPLIAHFLNLSLFPDRQFYAPIDAVALEQYKVFSKLGFFGIDLGTTTGAGSFLKQSTAILQTNGSAIWITPEGRFADARDHSAELMPGLAHLCTRMKQCTLLPLALEYVFWDERLPICLSQFGTPILVEQNADLDKAQWNQRVTQQLRHTQDELAELAIARSSQPFDNLLVGRAGVGGLYDSFRRAKSLLTRKRFQAKHGDQFK